MRKDTRYRPGNRARHRPCLLCKKIMRQDHIDKHVRRVHLRIKDPKVKCDWCQKEYSKFRFKHHKCYLTNKRNKAEKP